MITYGTPLVSLSGNLAAGSQVPVGETVVVTLDGVENGATIGSDGSFSTTFDTAALQVSTTAYTVSYFYKSDGTYASASGTSQLTVTPAILTLGRQIGTLISVELDGNSTTVSAGPITGTSITYNNGTPVDLPSGAYSVDLQNSVPSPQSSYSTAIVSDDGVVNGTPVNNADQIAWLLSHEAASANTPTTQAGLQAAIWSVEYNGPGHSFILDQGDQGTDQNAVYEAAQQDLADLATAFANGNSGAIGALLWITPSANYGVQAQVALDPTYDTTSAALTENITYGTTLDQAVNGGQLPAVVYDQGNAVEGTYAFTNSTNGNTTDVTGVNLDAGDYNLTATFTPNDNNVLSVPIDQQATVNVATLYLKLQANNATKVYGQTNDQAVSVDAQGNPVQVVDNNGNSIPGLNAEYYISYDSGNTWSDIDQGADASSTAGASAQVLPSGQSYTIDPNYTYGEGGNGPTSDGKVTAKFQDAQGDTTTNPATGPVDIDITYVQGALTITPAPVTVSGITASNKPYDSTTTAALNTGNAALVGVFSGDTVTLNTDSATGTFASKDVANGITVTVAGLTISGPQAGDYALTQPTTTANITPATLTVSGITANSKVYNATTTAALNTGNAALVGVFSGDTVTLNTDSATGTFASKDVANGITVTVAGLTISGPQAGDYALTQPTTTANITPATLTVSGITANSKVYNANTTAALNTGSAALVGVFSGDTVTLNTDSATGTFASKDVANGITVSVAGLTIGGPQAFDYSLTQPTTTANITPAPLTVSATALNKVYDGTATATVKLSDNRFAGDALAVNYTALFTDPNAGNNKTVNVSVSISGLDAGDYYLVDPTTGLIPKRGDGVCMVG